MTAQDVQTTCFPHTSLDLQRIAGQLDDINMTIGDVENIPDDDWRWGLSVTIYDDSGHIAGHVKPHGDGWLGFYPSAVSE